MITSIVSEAGGVGKTTISLNVAYALSQRGYNVLVVDLDPNQSMQEFIGADPPESLRLSSAALLDESPHLSFVRAWDSVDVSLSCKEMRSVLASLSGRPGFQYVLADALRETASHYDFIIIDPPGTAGNAQTNACFAAHNILIPVVLEVKLNTIESLVDRVTKDFATARSIVSPVFMGVQPNMYQQDAPTHKFYLDALGALDMKVFEPIGDFKAIATASANGLPLTRRNHPGLTPFNSLADAFVSAKEAMNAKAA